MTECGILCRQIVGSICEFVEVNTAEIRSGWRPLFGALRSVRPAISSAPSSAAAASPGHVRIVLDVFEAFLNTDNVLVFANAAVDCIMCLLKHVRGPSTCPPGGGRGVSGARARSRVWWAD